MDDLTVGEAALKLGVSRKHAVASAEWPVWYLARDGP